jgi:hypothetical protein
MENPPFEIILYDAPQKNKPNLEKGTHVQYTDCIIAALRKGADPHEKDIRPSVGPLHDDRLPGHGPCGQLPSDDHR